MTYLREIFKYRIETLKDRLDLIELTKDSQKSTRPLDERLRLVELTFQLAEPFFVCSKDIPEEIVKSAVEPIEQAIESLYRAGDHVMAKAWLLRYAQLIQKTINQID